jgi:hypothetical protein
MPNNLERFQIGVQMGPNTILRVRPAHIRLQPRDDDLYISNEAVSDGCIFYSL